MFNLPTLLSAVAIAGTSLTAGLDGIDAAIDSLIRSKKLEQNQVCIARAAAMLLPSGQRPDAESSCSLYAAKEIDDRYAPVKDAISSFRVFQ